MTRNATILEGNVTRDPDIMFGKSGNAFLPFSIACSNSHKDANGQWVDDDPDYFDIIVFGDLAENLAATMTKGTAVIVSGRPRQRKWEDKETKKTRYATEFVADNVGISLRWATAVVTKVSRAGAAGPSQPVYQDDEEPF